MSRIGYGVLVWLFGLALMAAMLPAPSAEAFGPCDDETPCEIADGEYRIHLPPNWSKGRSVGAVIFFHGWRGKAERTILNGSIRALTDRLNMAFVAPDGRNQSWSFPSSPSQHRDELAFVTAVFDDLERRFNIDISRSVVSGFSLGGSMSWYTACYLGDRVGGFAPVAGAFWEPLPDNCPAAIPTMVHIHGLEDGTVPMEGRPIGRNFHQGDVYESFAILGKGECAPADPTVSPDPDASADAVGLTCSRATCDGAALELCVHPGGHSYRTEWLERALSQIGQLKGWSSP
ncbi:MAG: alpha/beta hydrolase family esterase [Rhodospirillaceae bacterium]